MIRVISKAEYEKQRSLPIQATNLGILMKILRKSTTKLSK